MNRFEPENPSTYFLPSARARLARLIEEHGGLEVFFVGYRGEVTGKIQAVDALCRGNADRVPAILDAARPGDVVIHNHPSGRLVPSDADCHLASHYGNIGVGFLIVNNAVDALIAVVRPRQRAPRTRIEEADVLKRLGPVGELSRTMKGFEYREGQVKMAKSIARAFNDNGLVAVEAGTGTGKSMAYLLPAALNALANDETVVVATHTINLQEQLYSKDGPQLQSLEGLTDLRIALLKGRGNYLCNRKFDYYRRSPSLFIDEEAEAIHALAEWEGKTSTGMRSELNFALPGDLWNRLAASDDDCTRVKCPFYEECYYYKARKEAAGAHILIVNQHLLLADLSLRYGMGDYKRALVLPPYTRVILDEAHHLEDVATSFIQGRVSQPAIHRQLARLLHLPTRRTRRQGTRSGDRRGLLVHLAQGLAALDAAPPAAQKLDALISTRLEPEIIACQRLATDYLQEIGVQLHYELNADRTAGEERTLRITPRIEASSFWRDVVAERVDELEASLARVAAGLDAFKPLWEELPTDFRAREEPLALELSAIRERLVRQALRLRTFLSEDENTVRWLELETTTRGTQSAVLATSPIEVNDALHSMVFEPMKTVALASATLTVAGRFDYFAQRVGLKKVPSHRLLLEEVASPFDLDKQVLLGIPDDMPEPGDPDYSRVLLRVIQDALLLSDGGAFVLFTSYRLLNEIHQGLRTHLRLPLFKHGAAPRHLLLEQFRSRNNGVLLGTSSFWEGVDVPGDALRLVIITRLPFQVPSEPIQQARAEKVTERGGDPFRDISLPQAVIRFKQGFGRLIRKRDDKGVVLVLDRRIVSRRYGLQFLDSISEVRPLVKPTTTILREAASFFHTTRGARHTLPSANRHEPTSPDE